MKKMQDFHNKLLVEGEVTTLPQNHLASLTNFKRSQINSLVQFDPWYLWGEAEVVKQA